MFIVSDVIVIFGWSHLRLMDSHFIISLEHMSDLRRVPIELLMSHQDRSDTFDAIRGHISLIWIWRWSFSHKFVAVLITWPRDIISALLVTIRDSSRWAFSRVGRSGCDCLAIRDSSDRVSYPIRSFFWRLLKGSFDFITPTHWPSIFSRLMESLSDFSDGLRVFGDPLHWGIFSPHHSLAVRHLEPLCLLSYDGQRRLSQFDAYGYSV